MVSTKYSYINMDTKPIDLTDPLEELLRRTGWSPEYLQERLLKFTANNVKKTDSGSSSVTPLNADQEPVPDIIEVSDDEENEPSQNVPVQDSVSHISIVEVSTVCNENDGGLSVDNALDCQNENNDHKELFCSDIIQLSSDSESDDEQDIRKYKKQENAVTQNQNIEDTKENGDRCKFNDDGDGLDIQVTNCTMEEFKNLVQRENSLCDTRGNIGNPEFNISACCSGTKSIDVERIREHETGELQNTDAIISDDLECAAQKSEDVINSQSVINGESEDGVTIEQQEECRDQTRSVENISPSLNSDVPRQDNDDEATDKELEASIETAGVITDDGNLNEKANSKTEIECEKKNELFIIKDSEDNNDVITTEDEQEASHLDSREKSDELRENLKLQLSTLRTRKKVHLVEEIKTKIVDVEYKKKPVLEVVSDESTGIPMELCDDVPSNKPDAPEIPKTNCESEQINEEEHVSNVFNEIRKIINKKKSLSIKTPKAINDELSRQVRIPEDDRSPTETTSVIVSEEVKPVQETTSSSLMPETSSPFVSNRLEEFLTDSKLNVSYTIPKSCAEEGLCRNYADETVIPTMVTEVKEDVDKPKRENKYKPKTLAEKRRLLERDKLREKRQMEKLTKLEQKQSYVVYRDEKVLVKTKTPGRCVGYFESTKPKMEDTLRTCQKKPSLLTDLFKRNIRLKYKAGPLSRKPFLQNGCIDWSTEVKKMPRVLLNVMPEPGRPIHGNLVHLLPKWDGEITEDQTEFALSALVSKSDNAPKKVFSFEASYENNEEHIMVRKRESRKASLVLPESPLSSSDGSSVEDEVRNVVQRLVNYVEIKELSSSLIKETEATQTKEESNDVAVPTIDNHVYVKRRQWKKRSKVDKELLRLNCKLVNVEVEDNEPERECSKEHCSLGCLCKSLQCEAMIGIHCRKINCIFGCTCPKEKDKGINISAPIKLPAGTNLLSKDTVNRIEDEAKKNLAKMEKEFTQTVIYTSNKAIVVGCGNKARRTTKVPKKYCDFFDDDEIVEKPKPMDMPKTSQATKPCYVLMDQVNFTDIVPYCLAHNLYDCFCKGEAPLPAEVRVNNEAVKVEADLKPTKPLKAVVKKDETMEESFKNIVRKAALQQDYYTEIGDNVQYSNSGRPLRKKRKVYGTDFLSDEVEKLPVLDDKAESIKPQVRSNAVKRTRTSRTQQNKRRTIDNEDLEDDASRKMQDQIQECFKTMEIAPDQVDVAPENGSIQSMFEFVFDDSDSHQSISDEITSTCSRTDGLGSRSVHSTKLFPKSATICDFVNNLTETDLTFAKENKHNPNLSDCGKFKVYLVGEAKLKESEVSMARLKKRKRKQDITPKPHEEIETDESNIFLDKTPPGSTNIKKAFEGEIIIRDGEVKKSLSDGYVRMLPWSALIKGVESRRIGVYCIESCPFKLIFTNGIKLKGANVFNVQTQAEQILRLSVRCKTPAAFMQTDNVRDIIKWLISGKLPKKYKDAGLAFLLLEIHPKYFEVRGICTQMSKGQLDKSEWISSMENPDSNDQIIKVKHRGMNNKVNEGQLDESGWINSMENPDTNDQIIEVKHRDMNNKMESLFITKCKYSLRELVEEGFDDDDTDNLYMWVGLPEVFKVAKWRVVFLNNDFAYLHFKTVNDSIKYTDLIRLVQMAKEEKHTLVLKNTHITQSSAHSQFGLYISHSYTDRIFIGPYFINDDSEDIETLRYINKSLVSSESFNRMKGNTNYKCGHWMHERSYSHQPRNYIKDVLDLTEIDRLSPQVFDNGQVKPTSESKDQNSQETGDPLKIFPTITIKKDLFNSLSNTSALPSTSYLGNTAGESLILEVPPDMTVSQENIAPARDHSIVSPPFEITHEKISNVSKDQQILYYNGVRINIKTAKPRTPSEFNRFVMTNIPNFGYLGAFQPDNSDELEISWPFEKKVLQFPRVENALEFLRERFNQLLQPVPETFKIEVDILTELDIRKHEPVNAKYLNGQCICGDFGILNFKCLDKNFCEQKLKISKREITQLFARKAQYYIKKKIQELAEIVGLDEGNRDLYTMSNILKKAREEIHTQEKLNRDLFNVISREEDALSKKLLKAYDLIKNMPKKYRNIESRIISDVLHIRPRKLNVSEVVEINDDDDVQFVSVTQLDENERSNHISKASDANLKNVETNSNDTIKFADMELKCEPATASNDALVSFDVGHEKKPEPAEMENEDISHSDEPMSVVGMAPLPIIQDVRSLKTYTRKSSDSPVRSKSTAVVKSVKLAKSPTGKFVLLDGTSVLKRNAPKGMTKFTIKDNKIINRNFEGVAKTDS